MATSEPTGKPPRKADQLLQALSRKYEEKARDREARSSGRTTPSRQTPRSSRERLFGSHTGDNADDATSSTTLNRSARGSPSVRSELFSPARRRSPSIDSNRQSRATENRSPAVKSANLFDRKSPGRRVSPVQSPGLFERARKSPSPSPAGRTSPSNTLPHRASPSITAEGEDNPRSQRSSIFSSLKDQGVLSDDKESEESPFDTTPPDATSSRALGADSQSEAGRSDAAQMDEEWKPNGLLPRSQFSPEPSYPERSRALSDVSSSSHTTVRRDLPTRQPNTSANRLIGPLRERDKSSEKTATERMYNPERSLDRSTDTATIQDDATSRRSSMSNYSFNHQMTMGSPRSSAVTSPLPTKSYAMEKEHSDSQLRKLELENTSLKHEVKSWKDKYSRSQSQIIQLETKLKSCETDLMKLRSERKKEISRSRKKSQEAEDSFQDMARGEQDELYRKIDLLKLENDSLEKELSAARRMTDTAMQGSDLGKITSAYKLESTALRNELKRVKLLMKETERSLETEVESKNKINEANRKLAEMNSILKQQLEMDSGGTVADKQVKGIESRLKITEDRLFQERSDRAAKLSEIEDKLLNENSKLQIEVKDLTRQLNREREKLRVTENKLQDLKDQQLSLNFFNQSNNSRRTPRSAFSTDANKKFSPEVAKIVESISKDSGVILSQENDLIMYLHNKEQAVMKQLNDWKNELQQLRDLHHKQRAEVDNRKLLEDLNNSEARSEEAQTVLNTEISQLVKDKHESMASLKTSQDRLEAAEAELEYLRVQLKIRGGEGGEFIHSGDHQTSEMVVKLEGQIHSLKLKISQLERSLELKQGELTSLQSQLDAKSTSFDQAVQELGNLRKGRFNEEGEADRRQRKIEQLNVKMKSLNTEISSLKEKNRLATQAKNDLENKLEVVNLELDKANESAMSSTRTSDTFSVQKSQLQVDLNEKKEEMKTLRSRYDLLENKHTESRENLILAKDNVAALERQVDALQQQLVAKSSEYESITSRLQSQESSYTTTESRLLNAQKETEDLRANLSVEKLNYTKLRSESEREAANQRHEVGRLNRDVHALNETVESLRAVKSDLSKDVEVSKVKMAELQARLSEAQADISAHKEKEKTLSEERDRLTEEKHEAKLTAARLEAEHKQETQELSRVIQGLKHEAAEMKVSLESSQANYSFEYKKALSDLDSLKKQLEKKDRELEQNSEALKDMKHELEIRNSRIKELENQLDESNYSTKQIINELNENLRQKSVQIESYERSLKNMDEESRSRKELEVRLRQLEQEIEQKIAIEIKQTSEINSLHELQLRDKEIIDRLQKDGSLTEKKRELELSRLKDSIERYQEENKEQRTKYDKERTTLQDRFNQVNSDFKAAEATISVMNESKQSQLSTISNLERRTETLKSQLQESQVNEKLATQKMNNMKDQLDETRNRLVNSEERLADTQADLVKLESDVKIEREKLRYLKSEKDDSEAAQQSLELKNDMYQRDVNTIQAENSVLRDEIESLREIAESRNKKQQQQFKAQIDSYEKEKGRLQLTNQELSTSLGRLKEQVNLRNEEIQKFRQQSLINEQHFKEASVKLTRAEDALSSRDDTQEKLQKRNVDLELELSELKSLVSRMEGSSQALQAAESSKIDNVTRAELNRTMTEWNSRLQSLLESNGGKGDSFSEESRLLMVELEGKLKHEQLMHQVTKNQLKSVEEENTRLRKRLLSTPKRRDHSGKSRAELIQEKIMESEMRVASQMGLGSTLLSTTNFSSPRLTSTYRSTNPYKSNLNGIGLLGSLGFTSPTNNDRLNNTLNQSLNGSLGDADSQTYM